MMDCTSTMENPTPETYEQNSSGDYDTYERLHMHHTVASLAQRIDFDVSMLEHRKEFDPSMFRRRHSVSTSTPATEPARTPSAKLKISTQTVESLKLPKPNSPPAKKVPSLPPKAPSSSNSKKKATKSKASLSRMIASNKGSTTARETSSSSVVSSTASTVQIENTGQPSSARKKDSKYANLTVDVSDTDVVITGDNVGGMSHDAEDAWLSSLLSAGGNLNEEEELVFGGGGSADESDPGNEFTEQETAMMQALERAVEEFETAAAVGTGAPLEDGEEHEGEEVDELLEVAAKTVADAQGFVET